MSIEDPQWGPDGNIERLDITDVFPIDELAWEAYERQTTDCMGLEYVEPEYHGGYDLDRAIRNLLTEIDWFTYDLDYSPTG